MRQTSSAERKSLRSAPNFRPRHDRIVENHVAYPCKIIEQRAEVKAIRATPERLERQIETAGRMPAPIRGERSTAGFPQETLAEVSLPGVICSNKLHMARPRGQRKTARLTVSLDERTYADLTEIARSQDVSIAWLARRALHELVRQHDASETTYRANKKKE